MKIKPLCDDCKIVADKKDIVLREFQEENPNTPPPREYGLQPWIDLCPECSWEMERVSSTIAEKMKERFDKMSPDDLQKLIDEIEEDINND